MLKPHNEHEKHIKFHKSTQLEISTKNQLLHLSAVNFVQRQKDITLCYTHQGTQTDSL
jgi:hypothetical protein